MADLGGFDATQHESEFEALPEGEYRCCIVESEKKSTKSGTGELLQVKLQVLDGPHKNRTLFDRFNLWNQSEKARAIAQQQFAAVCKAVNVLTPSDSAQLHLKPLMVRLKVTEYDGRERNEVKGYKACLPAAQQQPAKTEAKPASGTPEKPPGW